MFVFIKISPLPTPPQPCLTIYNLSFSVSEKIDILNDNNKNNQAKIRQNKWGKNKESKEKHTKTYRPPENPVKTTNFSFVNS